jgi:hydrogenase nickel incorporation protein HypB
MKINVVQKVMKVNDELAAVVRARLKAAGILGINMMSAPGSGKTTLLEALIEQLHARCPLSVIEGDPETALDAERIARCGVPVVQIETSGGCHLEANLVLQALDKLPLNDTRLLFIENVGNLVCPAEFDLGEAARIVMVSVPEGHDKPAKYPKIFRKANLVILNKIDLLPYVEFDVDRFRRNMASIVPDVPVLETSCTTGAGIQAVADWVLDQTDARAVAAGAHNRPVLADIWYT